MSMKKREFTVASPATLVQQRLTRIDHAVPPICRRARAHRPAQLCWKATWPNRDRLGMAAPPRSCAAREEKSPWNAPIGGAAPPAMTIDSVDINVPHATSI